MTVIAHVNLARGYRGGERQAELLIRGLAGSGWSQVVAARRGEPLAQRLRGVPGVEVRPVANNPVSAARGTAGADLVHAHDARAGMGALVANVVAGRPYLLTRRIPQAPSDRWLTRLAYLRAVGIVCVSAAVAGTMAAYVPEVPRTLIPDATAGFTSDPQRVAAIRSRWPGRLIAGNVGALVDKHKGQKIIIEAARRLRESHPELVFLLVGAGRDEAGLKALASDLPNVVFEGYRDNVGDYLAAFDMLVFPSREEGLGSSVLDAMSFGLPVVASRVGGLPEVVDDGATGLLVPSGDVDAFTGAVVKLAGDPELRRRMGEAGQQAAVAYAPAHMVAAYDRLYRRLLGMPPRVAEARP